MPEIASVKVTVLRWQYGVFALYGRIDWLRKALHKGEGNGLEIHVLGKGLVVVAASVVAD